MKKIIFFSAFFPFETVGENFFESELEGIAGTADKIYIVACNESGKNPEAVKKLPENVTAISANRKRGKSELILNTLTFLFHKSFWRELGQIRRLRLPFMPSLKTLVSAYFQYRSICRCFPDIAGQIEVSEDDEILFFGYWLHYISEALFSFRHYLKLDGAKIISRAHGPADIQNLMRPNRFYPFQKHLLENLDAIYGISESGCELLRKRCSHPEKIHKIYIGSYGNDELITHSRKPFTVMTCANFFVHKRINIVADAIHILAKEIPDIRWVHFGDGPLRADIENACRDIADNVTFLGNRAHGELLDYLKSGEPSVFVSASAAEGLPVSVMEAIGYSTPVIATDVNATCEAVITGKTGTLLPADISAQMLADEIKKYYGMDGQAYSDICNGAFGHWKEKLDCRKNARVLADAVGGFFGGNT